MLKTGHELPDAEIRLRYERLTWRGGLGPEFVVRVLALAGDLHGRRVLDVGCGTGDLLRAAAQRSDGLLVGVDFAVARLARAAGGHRRIHLVQHDLAQPLPFASASFDVVFCTETLEHLKHPEACLAEIRRVLHPAGRLVVSVPNATGFFPFNRLAPLVPGRWMRGRLLPYEHPDNTCFDYGEIRRLVRDAGFEIERCAGYRYLRYLQLLPLVRSVYGVVYPLVERCFPRLGAVRFAYNLILRCRRPA